MKFLYNAKLVNKFENFKFSSCVEYIASDYLGMQFSQDNRDSQFCDNY